ncbi:esterase-5B-like [Musca vetustissima]|uniref:esterase-5B-like n=1 Tax=Musca vetustissima TaxID=27455 RepID=UPI002AB7CC7C|nr:esterase-5B-like [Musca vetustissima]
MVTKTVITGGWILLTFIISAALSEVPKNSKLFVEIANGVLKGKDNNGRFISWESVPYAEAPVGELRYELPQPYGQKWNVTFDASQKAPACMQWDQFVEGKNKVHGSEDCLKLNIYKPLVKDEKKLPVMVFIHGGCFMFGGVNVNQPDVLMASGKIMLVTIAYRVGALGFLSMQDEGLPGNLGLKDQRLALQWIKENIVHFGGDPKKILLTGFSAGGASTHFHILQRPEENVAKAAVSFSGVALNPWVIIRNPRGRALKLAQHLNCPQRNNGGEIKNCLKQRRAEDIVGGTKLFQNFAYNPFTVFGPVIEPQHIPGAFLTHHPIDIVKSGNFTHIPWLASYVSEDGGYNAAELMLINPQTGRELMYELNENWAELLATNLFLDNISEHPVEYARQLKEKYLGHLPFYPENYARVSELYTAVLFSDGILDSLKLHRQYSHAPVYGYVYNNPADFNVGQGLSKRTDVNFGTVHMDDLSLILPTSSRSPPRSDEKRVSQNFIEMLVNFVESGNLCYDHCDFADNSIQNSPYLFLTSITGDNCESVALKV